MSSFHRLYKLKGVVQHYSWGGFRYIPELLSVTNEEHKPYAEYWLGAHPNHPSHVIGQSQSLYEFITHHRAEILGDKVAGKFSSLPFLFKILDVQQMLSIQVHPSMAAAKKGYAEENTREIDVKAPNRNYKDENHKPEMMVALGDFWLLHGFKSPEAIQKQLQDVPELTFLQKVFQQQGYRGLFELVMVMQQADVDERLEPLLKRIVPLYKENKLAKESPHYWAARAAITFRKGDHIDRGIFCIYLFNILHLKEGEGIFQASGMPHAYLEGQNVEVMANSDNVLRAGLTDKHIDVAELVKHVLFEETIPDIICPNARAEIQYQTPAEEFSVVRYQVDGNPQRFTTQSADIIFALSGEAIIKGDGEEVRLKKGEALLVTAGTAVSITSDTASTIFRAFTPVG